MHFKCIHLPTSYFQKQDKCWEAPKRVYSMPLFICLAAKRILKHVPKVTQFPQALIRRCQLLDEFVFQSGLNFANLKCQMVEQFKYSEKATKISRIFSAKLSLNKVLINRDCTVLVYLVAMSNIQNWKDWGLVSSKWHPLTLMQCK